MRDALRRATDQSRLRLVSENVDSLLGSSCRMVGAAVSV
jgi:hypothetical protein